MTRKLLCIALAAISFNVSAAETFVCTPAGDHVSTLCSVWCKPKPAATPMLAPEYTPVDPFDDLVGKGWPPGTVKWNNWFFFPYLGKYHGPFLSLKELEGYFK